MSDSINEQRCPGWREDGGFDPDACKHYDDESDALLVPFEEVCRCVHDCGDPGEAGCCYCNHTDCYEPCEVVGFGCGCNARPYVWGGVIRRDESAQRCDCCTDEQWTAAAWLDRPLEVSGV